MNKSLSFTLLALVLLASTVASCASRPQATPTPAPTPVGDLPTIAITFLQALAKGDYDAAAVYYDAKMKEALPAQKMQAVWSSLTDQFGAFQELSDTYVTKSGQYDVVFVTCEFEKGLLDAKVVFDGSRRVSGLWFVPHQERSEYQPPAYVKSDSFDEQEVLVGTGDSALPGTLSMPLGQGPFPAIVLVHGSGPNDRDETIEANKPFRDLAWGLASQSIAVLRYEKRSKAHPEQLAALKDTLTVKEEVIDDALAAVALLRNTAGIDPGRVFVLGHSLGGTLAPRIGKADRKIAGLIIMAGANRPLEDLVLTQSIYLANLDGSISESEQKDIDEIRRQVEQLKDTNLSAANKSEVLLGAPVSYWLDLRGYHPAEVAAELDQPMFILQGERDYQVTMEDFEGWEKALSGRTNVEFRLYPRLNHLFIAGEGKSTPAEYQTPGHVDEAVINDIAAWIKKQQ